MTDRSQSNIRELFEKLEPSKMDNAHPISNNEFNDIIDTAGLMPCTASHKIPCFEFPDLKKIISPSASTEAHEVRTELADNLNREIAVRKEHDGEISRRLVNQFKILMRRYPRLKGRNHLDYLSIFSGEAK